jgi:hypothetical protein
MIPSLFIPVKSILQRGRWKGRWRAMMEAAAAGMPEKQNPRPEPPNTWLEFADRQDTNASAIFPAKQQPAGDRRRKFHYPRDLKHPAPGIVPSRPVDEGPSPWYNSRPRPGAWCSWPNTRPCQGRDRGSESRRSRQRPTECASAGFSLSAEPSNRPPASDPSNLKLCAGPESNSPFRRLTV